MTIGAAIFDLDGLLIDSEPLWHEAEISAFAEVGLALTPRDCLETTGLRVDEVVEYWRQRRPWSDARAPNAPAPNPLAANAPATEALAHTIVTRVERLIATTAEPKPGVAHAIALASRLGLSLALASSSPRRLIDAALCRLGLEKAFAVIHSASDESHGKPHPAVYLTTATRLGLAPSACVAIEDSLNGVIAAKAARMRCVAVPEVPGDRRFALADVTLASLAGLTAADLLGEGR